ncbi:MAG: sigma-54 interaction domain-containing protein [Candidatus Acidiferrales bacterium]
MATSINNCDFLPNRKVEAPPEAVIFGCSPVMRAVHQKLEKVAKTTVPILIQGESGTGKEILARYTHATSTCGNGPFVKVNCAAIPGTLLESELFGFQKGAFTGAYASKPGRVEMAHRGTLFLDEIAELDPGLQAKLLQLLQDGQFCRIGDAENKHVEARIICATNRNLEKEIATGNFRQDLYYRINVICIQVPPLRDRREDIPVLVDYFLEYFKTKFQRQSLSLSQATLEALQNREWRGNVRELENAVARFAILGTEDSIFDEVVERQSRTFEYEKTEDGSIPLKRIAKEAIREMERDLILRILKANHWNRRKTAEVLKISYRALLYKIRQAGLPPKRMRRGNGTPSENVSGSPTIAD